MKCVFTIWHESKEAFMQTCDDATQFTVSRASQTDCWSLIVTSNRPERNTGILLSERIPPLSPAFLRRALNGQVIATNRNADGRRGRSAQRRDDERAGGNNG